jgi:hypothetical protein
VQTNLLLSWLSLILVVTTSAWFLYRSLQRSHEPARLAWRWFVSACLVAGTLLFLVKGLGFGGGGSFGANYAKAFIIAITIAVCGILLGILWAPSIGALLASPLVGLFDGGGQEIQPEPCYSAALRSRKRGEYHAAMDEVERQLSAFPGDLPGTLLLVDIQADDLHDPHSAIQTLESWILRWADTSDRLPSALHRIADLHLDHLKDPLGAQSALDRIVHRFPGTQAAHLAAQRIAHLASVDMLADKAQPHRIRIGHYPRHPGRNPRPSTEPIPRADASVDPCAAIAKCSSHLHQFPNDDEAREQLARLYAELDGDTKRAGAELEYLIAQPGATNRQIARWLNLLTDLQLHIAGDEVAARATLQRILDRCPDSAVAENARHRLALIKLELRRTQTPRSFRLDLKRPQLD